MAPIAFSFNAAPVLKNLNASAGAALAKIRRAEILPFDEKLAMQQVQGIRTRPRRLQSWPHGILRIVDREAG